MCSGVSDVFVVVAITLVAEQASGPLLLKTIDLPSNNYHGFETVTNWPRQQAHQM
jgi:hypothetical protein